MKKKTVENKAAFLESLSVFSVPYRVADCFFMKKKRKKKRWKIKPLFWKAYRSFLYPTE